MALDIANGYDDNGNAPPGEEEDCCALHDKNERMEHLYNHMKDVVKDFGPKPPDHTGTINEIKQILKEHLARVRETGSDWSTTLNDKTNENNSLRDTIRTLKAQQNDYDQAQVLEQGINEYIQKRTKEMEESLAIATRERDGIYSQLEEEKKAHNASLELVKEFKSKSEALTTLIGEMRNSDRYNVHTINAEIAAERDKLQQMYNELKVKSERKRIECDQPLSDKLDEVIEAITQNEDVMKTRSLWQQDLEELKDIYHVTLQEKGVECDKTKLEMVKAVEEEYKHSELGIKERLQLSLKECKDLKVQFNSDKISYERENAFLIFLCIAFFCVLIMNN